jgi:hypothetical protein
MSTAAIENLDGANRLIGLTSLRRMSYAERQVELPFLSEDLRHHLRLVVVSISLPEITP